MKHKLYFFCLLLLALKNSFASTNTATSKAYCYSFQLEAIQFPIWETTIHFTTYGARNNYHHIVPMNNLYQAVSAITAIVNYEVKPDKIGSQTYRADYLSQDDAGLDDHGTLNLSIPNVDGDLNGVPDFLQQEKSVSITVSGTLDSKWSSGGPEWVRSHPVTFTFTRSAGNHAGTYSGSLSGDDDQSYPFNGSWYVINKSGTVAYDGAGSQTTTITSTYSNGSSASFSGTGSYTVESEDEMTFAAYTIASVFETLNSNGLSLTRQGRQYSGASTVNDGDPSTNWVDFENWKVFITDTNDYDSDGIPDFTDPLVSARTPTHAVTLSSNPENTGSLTGDGAYEEGQSATITAVAMSGYDFTGWSGDASGTTNPITITVDAAKNITANFVKDLSDDDGDGLSNYAELITYGTNNTKADTDGDGLTDKQEIDSGWNPKSSDRSVVDAVMRMMRATSSSTPFVHGWFYYPSRGWMWTNRTSYPYFYDSSTKAWMYFKSGEDKPRFYHFGTKAWVTLGE